MSRLARPRICFVGLGNLPVLAPEYGGHLAGGAELQQTLLARALIARGFDVAMVVADLGQADGATWGGVRTFKAYRPESGLPVWRFVHPRWTSVWSALARADADVYYVSCSGMLVGEVALFARRHGRRLVFRVASDSDCDPRTLLVRYRRDRELYRLGLRSADVILAQTASQQAALRRHYGCDSRIVASLAEPGDASRGFEAREIDVLWVGNLRPLKRAELLLDLADRLPSLRFHLVGGPMPGDEAYFAHVREASAARSNVRFHGFVPPGRVAELFARSRLLVNSSRIEGFPNTFLQAWAHGVPVASFHDPEHLIAKRSLGFAVQDVDQLAEACTTLARDATTWQLCSERCRQYFSTDIADPARVQPYVDALLDANARRGVA